MKRASEAVAESDDTVICTGCGDRVPKSEAEYLDHADNISGTVWHCSVCAEICNAEPSEA